MLTSSLATTPGKRLVIPRSSTAVSVGTWTGGEALDVAMTAPSSDGGQGQAGRAQHGSTGTGPEGTLPPPRTRSWSYSCTRPAARRPAPGRYSVGTVMLPSTI